MMAELEWLRVNWPDPDSNSGRVYPRKDHQRFYVFCHADGSRLMSIKRSFKRAKHRASLDGVKFHDLRRTFVTWIAQAGYNPRVAQELAGHTDASVTLAFYMGADRREMRSAVESLPDLKATASLRLVSNKS